MSAGDTNVWRNPFTSRIAAAVAAISVFAFTLPPPAAQPADSGNPRLEFGNLGAATEHPNMELRIHYGILVEA
jgi:predicted MFS family arabinose efflux permease